MENKKILLIDDDQLITMSLELIISKEPDFEIVGQGGSGREAIALYDELQPDLLLMDIRMADMNGLEAAEAILDKHRDATILFLTTFSDDEYIVKALKLGVKGYLLKQDYKSLPAALHAAMDGQSVFGGAVIDKLPTLMTQMNQEDRFDYRQYGISEKEYEVIQLVAEGFSNKEIAQKLFLSEGTVRNYLSTVLEKLNLRDRTQLAIFYLKHEK
ncbi:MAG: response regulator transcription factor [Lachnospiraceae bacterium]|nr:response regulator transcription factor [Lachnospiraceae bacterium]